MVGLLEEAGLAVATVDRVKLGALCLSPPAPERRIPRELAARGTGARCREPSARPCAIGNETDPCHGMGVAKVLSFAGVT